VVALRCTNGKFITWEETHNQIGPYPPWNPGPPNLTIYGEVNATVTVYRFSWDSISPGQYLEIFNTDGTRVFSDTGDFMRILDFKTGYHYPGHTLTNGYVVASTTHASNIVTAVAQCYPCKLSLQSYETRLSYHFNSTSTTANFDEYVRVPPQYEDQIAWDYETFYPYYGYLVLDVTGL
jgi:hypothetical protein